MDAADLVVDAQCVEIRCEGLPVETEEKITTFYVSTLFPSHSYKGGLPNSLSIRGYTEQWIGGVQPVGGWHQEPVPEGWVGKLYLIRESDSTYTKVWWNATEEDPVASDPLPLPDCQGGTGGVGGGGVGGVGGGGGAGVGGVGGVGGGGVGGVGGGGVGGVGGGGVGGVGGGGVGGVGGVGGAGVGGVGGGGVGGGSGSSGAAGAAGEAGAAGSVAASGGATDASTGGGATAGEAGAGGAGGSGSAGIGATSGAGTSPGAGSGGSADPNASAPDLAGDDGGGCGCRTSASVSRPSGSIAWLMIAFALVARRRRLLLPSR